MLYRKLGKTGLNVSVVGLGTWQLGGEWGHDFTPREAEAIFDAARDEGINLIDTAECYGDHTSERLIGHAIVRDRERWVVATKFGHHWHGWMNRTDDFSVQTMRRQLEDSLRALNTDTIDLYQIHGASPQNIHDEALWTELFHLRETGKIRAIGVSCRPDPALLARPEIEAAQLVYNRLNRVVEDTVFPLCRQRDLGMLARVPLASGLLSGRYPPGHRFAQDDMRAQRDPAELDAELREVARIREEEVPAGADMATWALAWCLRHLAVTAIIPGCKSPEQVRANAAAARVEIGQSTHPQALTEPPLTHPTDPRVQPMADS